MNYKKIIIGLVILFFAIPSYAKGVYVRGYYRSNGTYVNGYYRTAPNTTIFDNYSTIGNINPYTGKEGTKPAYHNKSYYCKDKGSHLPYQNDYYSGNEYCTKKKSLL